MTKLPALGIWQFSLCQFIRFSTEVLWFLLMVGAFAKDATLIVNVASFCLGG
jgi:hypothetical protein